eukprot:scpid46418/ scgid26886/ 
MPHASVGGWDCDKSRRHGHYRISTRNSLLYMYGRRGKSRDMPVDSGHAACQQYMLSRTTMEQTSEFGHHGRSCGARLHNVTGPSPPPLQTGDYLLFICDDNCKGNNIMHEAMMLVY